MGVEDEVRMQPNTEQSVHDFLQVWKESLKPFSHAIVAANPYIPITNLFNEEGKIMKSDIYQFCQCNGSGVKWGDWNKAVIKIQCPACFGTGIIPYVGHAPFGSINHV